LFAYVLPASDDNQLVRVVSNAGALPAAQAVVEQLRERLKREAHA
jgi:hypothetical protein